MSSTAAALLGEIGGVGIALLAIWVFYQVKYLGKGAQRRRAARYAAEAGEAAARRVYPEVYARR